MVTCCGLALCTQVRPKEPPLPYPSIHAPWYGYLFWTIAAAGDYQQHTDANFVPAKINNRGKCGANLKVRSRQDEAQMGPSVVGECSTGHEAAAAGCDQIAANSAAAGCLGCRTANMPEDPARSHVPIPAGTP